MPSCVIVPAGEHQVSICNGLFVNGEFVDAKSGKTFPTVAPTTEKTICEVCEASAEDVNLAVDAATAAFPAWSRLCGSKRGEWLTKLVHAMEKVQDQLAAVETLDNGKPLADSVDGDIPQSIDAFKYYSGWCNKITGQSFATTDHLDFTRRIPYGVVACIIPWNYPLAMLSWKVAPALACGNTVVLKPSEKTPLTALMFAELCKQINLPKGVFNIVCGGGDVGAALAHHMKVPRLSFTGSTATGRNILKAAADSNLKKVTLELGGKSPFIVFDDADNIDMVAYYAAMAAFSNAGQVCTAGSRTFVHEKVYDQFLTAVCAVAENLMLGDPFDDMTQQGPQVDKIQFDKVLAYIEKGKAEGATVAKGGKRRGDVGYWIEPTVFTNVQDNHTIAKEEIFGPVCCLLKFSSEAEVIERANNTVYGLAAGVFTADLNKGFRVEKGLEAGTVWINHYGDENMSMPFGGMKQSGFGRELGESGIEEYTQLKSVQCVLKPN